MSQKIVPYAIVRHVIDILSDFQVLKLLIQQNVQIGPGNKQDIFAVSILANGGSIPAKASGLCGS